MPEGGDGPSSAMSAPESTNDRRDAGAAVDQAPQKTEEQAAYSMSPGLSGFLGSQQIAIAVSSYQSGKFYLLGQNVDGGLLVHERFFHKAMGICVADRNTILLATLFQILKFRICRTPATSRARCSPPASSMSTTSDC